MIVCATIFLLLAACSTARPNPEASTPPRRIISVVPNVTEMLFALGLGDRVIAVGDYDQFPPEVAAKPRIGGLLNPNIEKIIELKPDLVITYGSQDVLRERLQTVGVRMYPFVHGNVEQRSGSCSTWGKQPAPAIGRRKSCNRFAQHSFRCAPARRPHDQRCY